ncbi:aliphatic sulfonate ABC transporter substrate-binding protein [Paenibacillus filicis]|uniref:Aliphatic sulfonate ABC transporter substrate-binding protein n=1 Tax=Paenibacillus filicis TaxID=669464 RepID=A0ABU9DD17_9BACL
MAKRKVQFVSLLALLIVAGILIGVFAVWKPYQAKAEKPSVINVAINGSLSPLNIVKDKGWLEEELKKYKVTVAWSEFPSGPPLLEALAAKRVDLSFLGDGAALSGQSSGLPFVNVGLISDGKGLNSLLVHENSKIQTIADLKGKTIAVAKGTTSHVFLLKVLVKNGLTEKDVSLVNLQLQEGLPAFTSGKVDAWVTIEPYPTQLVLQKEARVLAGAEQGILAPATVIARTEFAKNHPELVEVYLSVFKRAADYANANREEVAQLFSELKKVPGPVISEVLKKQNYTIGPVNEEAIEAQQASADLLFENNFIKKKITFTDYVDNAIIKKIK